MCTYYNRTAPAGRHRPAAAVQIRGPPTGVPPPPSSPLPPNKTPPPPPPLQPGSSLGCVPVGVSPVPVGIQKAFDHTAGKHLLLLECCKQNCFGVWSLAKYHHCTTRPAPQLQSQVCACVSLWVYKRSHRFKCDVVARILAFRTGSRTLAPGEHKASCLRSFD